MYLKNSQYQWLPTINSIASALVLSVGCILFHSYVLSASVYAAEQKEPIEVNGDQVEYYHEKKEVVGKNNVSIVYKDVLLTCDKITVNLETRDAVAEGHVKIAQKDAYFTGDKISYNFDTRKGTIIDGYVNAKPFYGKAKELEKIANKDQYELENGYVTTCDLPEPHYRIQAKQVKIYLDDKIVARHILFMLGKVPVLYLPYYVQPLKDRKSHITVIPGQGHGWGYYVLTSYRYYFDDNNKGDLLLDYRTKKGLAGGVNHYYDLGQLGKGAFKFYYTHENDNLVFDKTGEKKTRYRYQARHRWELGEDKDTTAVLEFNKLSDRDIIKDYFYNEYEELGDNPDNYLSIITQKKDYSTELLFRKRFDKFYTVVERLPEYRLDIPNARITKDLPIYYKSTSSAVYLNQTFDTNAYPAQKDIDTVRIDTYNQFSYAARFFKALSVTPYAAVENTYYSRNRWGDTNQIRTIFNAGLDNSIKFYKIYDVETNFMGLDIHKLRHIITPTANYYFRHQPTISPDNLTQFDEIDALDTRNGITLALENRLQTKRMQGDQMKSVDLATLIVGTDYMFRLDKDNSSLKSNKFNGINFQLELIPYSWAYILSKMTVDTKHSMIQTASIDLVATGGDNWRVGIGHRYENAESTKNHLFTVEGMYKINEKWRVRLYERLNALDGALEEQEYTVSRDLHCWIAELTYNFRNSSDQTVWLVFKLKAFPDYPIGFRRTYSRPRFGSTGDTISYN